MPVNPVPAPHNEGAGPGPEDIAAAISQLDLDVRNALTRAFYLQQSTATIARELGTSETTVKAHLHTALRTLLGRASTSPGEIP
ncbi:sigma-70 family RNA polymerase sigma factor [Leifsonia shinshuensis]|uniref:sigma-70 family RNA polymerase sigma factor n=1 Tax=Leifsonia shinshuensis TaxID=150026 RepID=UPI0028596C10|nr:DNA-directed RNA polymerase specialized sigma24 family protein [Leifsonia shinshuensis]